MQTIVSLYPSARPISGRDNNGVLRARVGMPFAALSVVLLTGCEQNSFVPPPPPKVEVALPVQRNITRYLEATGNTAPIKTVDLVARVQGFLQSINGIASLALLYKIPLLLMITDRGTMGERDP